MKGKYITTDISIACLSKSSKKKNDVHAQIEETITERNRIMQELETFVQTGRVVQIYLRESNAA